MITLKYLAHVKTATSSKTTNLEIFPLNLSYQNRVFSSRQNRQKCPYHWLLYQKACSPDVLCVYNIFSKSTFCEISKQSYFFFICHYKIGFAIICFGIKGHLKNAMCIHFSEIRISKKEFCQKISIFPHRALFLVWLKSTL